MVSENGSCYFKNKYTFSLINTAKENISIVRFRNISDLYKAVIPRTMSIERSQALLYTLLTRPTWSETVLKWLLCYLFGAVWCWEHQHAVNWRLLRLLYIYHSHFENGKFLHTVDKCTKKQVSVLHINWRAFTWRWGTPDGWGNMWQVTPPIM